MFMCSYRRKISTEDENDLVDFLSKEEKPLVFDRHFYIFDIEKHGLNVELINMVRDPVDRIVSNYYFVRSTRRWKTREVVPPASWFTKNFNKCVLSNDPECMVVFIITSLNLIYKYEDRRRNSSAGDAANLFLWLQCSVLKLYK